MVGYVLSAIPLAVFGAIYLTRSEFMPYHAAAVGQSWGAVAPAFQVLLLALMKTVGGAFLALAVAVVTIALKPFREGQPWATWVLPLILLLAAGGSLVATLSVAQNTPAKPPTGVVIATVAVVVASFLLSLRKGSTATT
jgi:hypothetical protein